MTRLPNADELSKLTKAQLADRLDQAYREIERVEARHPLDGLDDEARAFHLCVKALDRLRNAARDRHHGYGNSGSPANPVWRVIGYLQDRFGIDTADVDGLRSRIRDLEGELEQARDRLDTVRRATTDEPGAY